MTLKIVIKLYFITNPAKRFQHYGYRCDGIMLNLAFRLVFCCFEALSGVPCSMEYNFRENELIFSKESLS